MNQNPIPLEASLLIYE